MNHPSVTELYDYADGVLSDPEAAAVEKHVSACVTCRRTIDEVQDMMTALRALPRELMPRRDLRPPVMPGDRALVFTETSPHTPLMHPHRKWVGTLPPRWMRAAAAIVLVAASAATVARIDWRSSKVERESLARSPLPEENLVVAGTPTASAYANATRELLAIYRARQPELDPEMTRIVQRNLAIMDAAILELELAREESDSGAEIARLLDERYRTRLDFLRGALALLSDV